MAGWEEELAGLLRKLGVEQERPASHRRPIRQPKQRDSLFSELSTERPSDPLYHTDDGEFTGQDEEIGEDDLWMYDLEIMRYEIDSIVNQVVRLMQRGDLDSTLKEDIMVVMHALRRHANKNQNVSDSEESYLEFATAMLHFCRLILQLNEVTSED